MLLTYGSSRVNMSLRLRLLLTHCFLPCIPRTPLTPHPRSFPEAPETIEFEVRTTTANGLLLWQGVVSIHPTRSLEIPEREIGLLVGASVVRGRLRL